MADAVECVVVGAGVVGLAVARRLAVEGREVVVLEAEGSIGNGTSSRNSEVIHAGIYYPPGSLKGRLCVAGKLALYEYCRSHGVAHKQVGKLIVATTEAEVPTLADLKSRAAGNGVFDIEYLEGREAIALEPELNCVKALLSPSTGIVDSHGLMLAYQGDAEAHGAVVAFFSPLLSARAGNRGFHLTVGDNAGGKNQIDCEVLIVSAGLQARDVAARIEGLAPAHIPAGHLLKGNYFTLPGKPPFRRLIYPVPVPGGAGTHVTVDLAGQVRFGPDTEPVGRLDYAVDPRRADSFYASIRRYYPGLRDGALQPGYAGIRPRLGADSHAAWDFVIQGPSTHGIRGLVNLFGIESPGLTASLALAEATAQVLAGSTSESVTVASIR
jgi:L-2-hydroxyglutarate oxidase LhgO